MSNFLDKKGLQALWEILDKQNSEVVKRIKALEIKPEILYDTKEKWDSQSDLQSKKGTIYIYSNYQKDGEDDIAGIKVGDGKAFLIDMPFIDTLYMKHINNSTIHITNNEREKWNNKVTSNVEGETLILTKE